MPTDKKLEALKEASSVSEQMQDDLEPIEEKVELTKRQRIIAAKKINLQRKRRQKLPPSLR
jgi:hypothetical protein